MQRDEFLANIRQTLQSAAPLPNARRQRPLSPPLADYTPSDLIPSFAAEVTALKGQFYRVATIRETVAQIAAIFAAHHATEYIAWAASALPIANLKVLLGEKGYTEHDAVISNHPLARTQTHTALSPVSIGLTGAMAGLADTGSLVLQSGSGRGRLASLLPLVHIALLTPNQLFPSLGHFVQAHPNAARNASNLVLVTGPSRTADIEQTLTLGVHGPKELHIILIDSF